MVGQITWKRVWLGALWTTCAQNHPRRQGYCQQGNPHLFTKQQHLWSTGRLWSACIRPATCTILESEPQGRSPVGCTHSGARMHYLCFYQSDVGCENDAVGLSYICYWPIPIWGIMGTASQKTEIPSESEFYNGRLNKAERRCRKQQFHCINTPHQVYWQLKMYGKLYLSRDSETLPVHSTITSLQTALNQLGENMKIGNRRAIWAAAGRPFTKCTEGYGNSGSTPAKGRPQPLCERDSCRPKDWMYGPFFQSKTTAFSSSPVADVALSILEMGAIVTPVFLRGLNLPPQATSQTNHCNKHPRPILLSIPQFERLA